MSETVRFQSDSIQGPAAIERIAEGLEFPIDVDELIRLVGDRSIDWTRGHSIGLRGILEECSEDKFADVAMLVSAISEVMKRREREPQEL